jgi:hypothetical protein
MNILKIAKIFITTSLATASFLASGQALALEHVSAHADVVQEIGRTF